MKCLCAKCLWNSNLKISFTRLNELIELSKLDGTKCKLEMN